MQLNFFNYKIIEIWDKHKELGVNITEGSFIIAHHFINHDYIVMEVIHDILDNKLDELIQALAWLYPLNTDLNKQRKEIWQKLLPQWRKIHNLKQVKEEFDWLKDQENVKKFIEKLESSRNNYKETMKIEPQ